MSKIKASAGGFTLVEIMVSMAVAAIVILSLHAVTTNHIAISQRGRYLNLANSYIEAKIEALRNTGYNSLAMGSTSLTSELPSQLHRSKTGSLTVTSPTTGIKQVVITISYTDQGTTKTYNYTTYLGELGVGQ